MMTDEETQGWLATIAMISAGFCVLAFAFYLGIEAERDQAIKTGYAHYEVDPATGGTRFVYGPGPGKAPQPQEKKSQ
jgi:hypothetical protein